MFKAIKFIAGLVCQNNEYQRFLSDIILQLHKPDNEFIWVDIDEANYIFEKIRNLQKENAELKEELDLVYNDMTAVVEKCCYTQYKEGEQPKIEDDQMKVIFEHIDKLHKDISSLIKERNEGV